jgi:hypothetical protein
MSKSDCGDEEGTMDRPCSMTGLVGGYRLGDDRARTRFFLCFYFVLLVSNIIVMIKIVNKIR